MNHVTIIGNLTADPELRFTQAGKPMVSGSIAVNRSYQVNGEWTEETSYFNYVVWGDQANNIAGSLNKGARVIASGRFAQKTWQDDNNNKRVSYDLVVDEMGPSMRWATADVTRVGKSESSQSTANADAVVKQVEEKFAEEEPF